MDKPITIGLDLPKNVFQVDGGYTEGSILCRRRSQMLAFSSRRSPVSSSSKPARALMIGRGN